MLTTRAFLAGLAGFGIGAARAQTAVVPYRTEIVVRTVRNLRTRADVAALVEMAAANHVDVINLAAKQDEDDEVASGTVFFRSAVAPRAPPRSPRSCTCSTRGAARCTRWWCTRAAR